jgi:hypothetical protein
MVTVKFSKRRAKFSWMDHEGNGIEKNTDDGRNVEIANQLDSACRHNQKKQTSETVIDDDDDNDFQLTVKT